jgi:hypothetical protein
MLAAVVVVPEFGGDKDVFTLDQSFIDGTLDTLAGFFLVLVVVCTVKQSIANLNGLFIDQRRIVS